ncbi:MAG: sensor histidine kinase [Bacteroidota bacterium]
MKTKQVRVSVSDSGVGINENNLNKLFTLNNNNSTEGTHVEQRTGLGLLLCKEFVHKHGGEIWVENQINKGSVFYFTLPLNGAQKLRLAHQLNKGFHIDM